MQLGRKIYFAGHFPTFQAIYRLRNRQMECPTQNSFQLSLRVWRLRINPQKNHSLPDYQSRRRKGQNKRKWGKAQLLHDTTKQLDRFQILGFTDNSVWPKTKDCGDKDDLLHRLHLHTSPATSSESCNPALFLRLHQQPQLGTAWSLSSCSKILQYICFEKNQKIISDKFLNGN